MLLWFSFVNADTSEQAGRGADEMHATLHSLHQAERDETCARLRREPVYSDEIAFS